MNLNKISKLIKTKRKSLGMTQEELAEKLFVTEKAVSRWETGRGTPDISLLLPLSKVLNIEVAELLTGEEKKKDIEKILEYNELTKSNKYNIHFKLVITSYVLSILIFLIYLRFEYDPNIELNYFIRLFLIIISSILIIIGNKIYGDNYVEKLEDKKKISKLSKIIIFIYYIILLFNMLIFARYTIQDNYNLIPLKTILEIISNQHLYSIIINIFGNLLIFMPLEYFIIELFNKNKFFINLLISILLITAIELLQLIFKVGVFDIDDIILCTSGMMLFYITYTKLKR